ncbi:hypothetical protein ACFXJ8_21145 [Nonomuraea sp. NPDC059194]|uniref:hypothetical protein n=1 Tax=Nonomuraea sp. NPDC059194 TaxID=3346764 RepID=UPI0036C9FC51
MAVTLRELTTAFPGWEIQEAAGGGWYAFRIVSVPAHSGLSNVRCGGNLGELHKHLQAEARSQVSLRPVRLRGVA